MNRAHRSFALNPDPVGEQVPGVAGEAEPDPQQSRCVHRDRRGRVGPVGVEVVDPPPFPVQGQPDAPGSDVRRSGASASGPSAGSPAHPQCLPEPTAEGQGAPRQAAARPSTGVSGRAAPDLPRPRPRAPTPGGVGRGPADRGHPDPHAGPREPAHLVAGRGVVQDVHAEIADVGDAATSIPGTRRGGRREPVPPDRNPIIETEHRFRSGTRRRDSRRGASSARGDGSDVYQ